jgi:hypothetical protein
MVKLPQQRRTERQKQFMKHCEKHNLQTTTKNRLKYELETWATVTDLTKPLNLKKGTIERILIDMDIAPIDHTGVSTSKLQTFEGLLNYVENNQDYSERLLEQECQMDYEDVLGPKTQKPISTEYDLGNWRE